MGYSSFIPAAKIEDEAMSVLTAYAQKYKEPITAPVPIEEILDCLYDVTIEAVDLRAKYHSDDVLAEFLVGRNRNPDRPNNPPGIQCRHGGTLPLHSRPRNRTLDLAPALADQCKHRQPVRRRVETRLRLPNQLQRTKRNTSGYVFWLYPHAKGLNTPGVGS